MKVLGISTSTPRGSVALADSDRVAGRVAYEGEMHHAERLFEALRELLAQAAVDRAGIAAVACDVGPGSFTGVRAGLAAAKGIALALAVPLIGVSSLEAMALAAWAEAAPSPPELLACLVDAKRGESFYAVYDPAMELTAGPGHVPSAGVLAALEPLATERRLRFVGDEATRLQLAEERTVVSEACRLPDAAWIARRAAERLARGAPPESVGDVQAVYLRAPDAVPQANRPGPRS